MDKRYGFLTTSFICSLFLVLGLVLVQAPATQATTQATITVDTTDDDNITNGNCTFREAIIATNTDSAVDNCPPGGGIDGTFIAFNIPGVGPHTIKTTSNLPAITSPVIIDGYTQPGASQNANPPELGTNAVLMIEIDSSNADIGLRISAGSSTVRGLVINRAPIAIYLEGNGENTVEGNFLGTDVTGSEALGGGDVELYSANNMIGGTTAGARNLISGNFRGIAIYGNGQVVQGNLIGTDATGTVALNLGNTNGIRASFSSNIIIGGTEPGARNVISGNGFGVALQDETSNILVQGNFIGTDVTGVAALGNSSFGIGLSGDSHTIGGKATGEGNVISSNQVGIQVSGSGHLIQGNFIGTDATGTADLGNLRVGINLSFGVNNTIGGTTAGARNIISGNGDGIYISQGTNHHIQGNFIGTDVTGNIDLGNTDDGVEIFLGSNNIIGGTEVGEGNVILGNNRYGIEIFGEGATGNLVQGNLILSNGGGVRIEGPGNTIGGEIAGAGNLISGNNSPGVAIWSSDAIENLVQGNTISYNNGDGIELNLAGTANAILSNSIFSNSGLGIDLGADGVTANDTVDGDTGPNNLQNFPLLTSVDISDSITIEGTFNSTPNSTFALDFFGNSTCDPSHHGEGEVFIGSTDVATDSSGNVSFTATFSPTIPTGQIVTATATDPNNNTSEFSRCAFPYSVHLPLIIRKP